MIFNTISKHLFFQASKHLLFQVYKRGFNMVTTVHLLFLSFTLLVDSLVVFYQPVFQYAQEALVKFGSDATRPVTRAICNPDTNRMLSNAKLPISSFLSWRSKALSPV